jgi:hypothetical protein
MPAADGAHSPERLRITASVTPLQADDDGRRERQIATILLLLRNALERQSAAAQGPLRSHD